MANEYLYELAGHSVSVDLFAGFNNNPFAQSVHYDHHITASSRYWELLNEIYRDLAPFAFRDRQWLQKALSAIPPHNVCATLITVPGKSSYVLCHARPIYIAGKDGVCHIVSGVAAEYGVMGLLH